jgi:regulatory protein
MKITAIKKQVKREGRYSVYTDEKFAFGISELGLINSGIKIGQELNQEKLDKLKDEADTDKLHNRALDLISRRPRSEWELRDYLKRKNAEPAAIDIILNTLSIRGYINDEDFARRWVENRRLLKPTSKRKLKLELRQKRISDEIINSILSEGETDEAEVLKHLVQKKRNQSRYQDDQKLMQYLARQGFNYEDIKAALTKED